MPETMIVPGILFIGNDNRVELGLISIFNSSPHYQVRQRITYAFYLTLLNLIFNVIIVVTQYAKLKL